MADEPNLVVNNESAEAETVPADATAVENETPSTETTTQEVVESEEQVSVETGPRERNRNQELANENRTLKEKVQEYEQKTGTTRAEDQEKFLKGINPQTEAVSQQPIQQPTANGLPWDQPQPTEVTMDDYKRDVVSTANAIAEARVNDVAFKLRKENEIRTDYLKVAAKYKELDPESDSYKKGLSEKIAGLFKDQVMRNPNAKLYDFTNAIMELREEGKVAGQSDVTARLVQQKAEEALTPSAEGGNEPEPIDIFKDPKKGDEQEAYLKKHGLWE